MSIEASQLRELIIRPTLRNLDLWSEASENLLMGTAAQESLLGRYLAQMGGGPAMGIFQMEPETHDDCWNNYLTYRADLSQKIIAVCAHKQTRRGQLIWNLWYATAMCRVQYNRFEKNDPLPPADNVGALASYWKRHWNTMLGKGTVDEFARNYTTMVEGR